MRSNIYFLKKNMLSNIKIFSLHYLKTSFCRMRNAKFTCDERECKMWALLHERPRSCTHATRESYHNCLVDIGSNSLT